METLNAARLLIPRSIVSDRERKLAFPLKKLNVHGGLVLLSSVFTTSLCKALTYEEALQQSTTAADQFDANAIVETVSNFVSENPLVIGGGFAILGLPLLVSQLLSKPNKQWGVGSAKNAYAKLGDDETSQLLDIREAREMGSPDIRGLNKKPVTLVYKREDKPGFLKKLALKFKDPQNTTLFILDKFDGNSELVAELVTANGFKSAYAIKDGAEGPRGWMNSGLPWILPKKTISLDLGSLSDALDGILGEGSDVVAVGLGLAAASGLGLLAFSEAETILQLLGSAALVQLVTQKLLFAEDRKQTLKQVDEIIATKVAPKELVGDIKQIGMALLPTPVISKSLPSAELVNVVQDLTGISRPLSPYSNYPDLKPPTSPMPSQANSSLVNTETVPISAPEINSPQVIAETLTGVSRPLSPYPNYPDLKPPTSPMPSQA